MIDNAFRETSAGLGSAWTATKKSFTPVIESAKNEFKKIPPLKELSRKALEASGRVLKNSANKALLNLGTVIELSDKEPIPMLATAGLWAGTGIVSLVTASSSHIIPPEALQAFQIGMGLANGALGTLAADKSIFLAERFNQLKAETIKKYKIDI